MSKEEAPIIKVIRAKRGHQKENKFASPDSTSRAIVAVKRETLKELIKTPGSTMFADWQSEILYSHLGILDTEESEYVEDLQKALIEDGIVQQAVIIITNYTPDINQQDSGTMVDSLRPNIEALLAQ